MHGEVEINIDVDHAGAYLFRVRSGKRQILSSINPDIAVSFYEDLRLLRWKSAGIHDPGDILLNHVGDRLAALIAPPAAWKHLGLENDALNVQVRFSRAAHGIMPLPWELLRIHDQFLIGVRGSHLVRGIPAPAGTRKRRNPVINVVHVSFGTDSALRLDEERCILLETIPAGIPIEFLIDPSLGQLQAVMDGFRPHIVVVSAHGHYDDLRGEHYLTVRDGKHLRTAQLVELCAFYGCKLLVLSTCESARLGGLIINNGTMLPADLIAFSFPVRTATATQSIACLFQELVRGRTISEAMAAVRAIDTEDEYAFFNVVHFHYGRARSVHVTGIGSSPPRPSATRCPGMEQALGTLNSFAHRENPVTLLAPVGSGGRALVQHWAELIQRSQSQATRWCVLLDRTPILDVNGAQLVRLAYPYSFVPVPMESLVYCDGMDPRFAHSLLAASNQDLAHKIVNHPLLGMLDFVNDLLTGHTHHEALEHFEQKNRMAERAGQLSGEGALFASWLFANKSVAATSFENRFAFAQTMKNFGMPVRAIVAGIENAVTATVILPWPDALILAPEFMLLGDRWFPNWQEDHRSAFQLLCAAFAALAAHDKVDVGDGSRLLDWAICLEDWRVATLICIALCGWYGERGRLEEMKATIECLLPHATGLDRNILRGHLVTIATSRGDYRTGLKESEQLETDMQSLTEDDDYYRNLQATISQQIDCLRELGRLSEAEQRWRDAYDLLPRLTEKQAEAEARLQGQLAHLRREQELIDTALDVASQAVQFAVANHCPAVLIAELRYTKADLLRRVGQDREAIEELSAIPFTLMHPALRSSVLHLKAVILRRYGAPQALEHLLESYQQDRMRGDDAGVAISLLTIARIFAEEREHDRARERIREAIPLADACGLVNVVGSLSLLRAEIDLAEGNTVSAASWLSTARSKFVETGNAGAVSQVKGLLEKVLERAK